MDYKKAYKNALERAKDCHVNKKFSELDDNAQELCEYIFPELKVNDEMIREELIKFIKKEANSATLNANRLKFKSMLTWLEKQGEPQPYKGNADTMRKNLIKAFKSVGSNHWGGFDVRDIIHFLESKDAIELEKQGEQKPTKKQVWDYCNKISSEWWQITMNKWETLTDEEKSEYNQYIGFNDFSDVLMNITAGALFRLIDTGKLEYEEGSLLLEKPDDTPKPLEVVNAINKKQGEQKPADLPKGKDYGIDGLYNAVRILEKTLGKVEGYQSDDGILEHKCAIDVVKNLYEKNHTWSEDDEKMMQYILKLNYVDVSDYIFQNIKTWLKSLRDRVQPQPKQEWSEEDEVMLQTTIDTLEDFIKGKLPLSGSGYDIAIAEIEWLKSLKPQSRWKPTDEQIHCFKCVIDFYKTKVNDTIVLNLLNSLYNNLLKL